MALKRRDFLTGLATSMIALQTGCSGNLLNKELSCSDLHDPLDRSLCRQKKIRDSMATQISVGALVGASIGLAVAITLRNNPFVGLLIGGATASLAIAAERYWALKLEEANGDMQRALKQIHLDAEKDKRIARQCVDDLRIGLRELKSELSERTSKWSEQLERLGKANELVVGGNRLMRTFDLTERIYAKLNEMHLSGRPSGERIDIEPFSRTIRELEAESKRYFDFMRSMGVVK